MRIDSTMIDSLMTWARTWTSGHPVTLEIHADAYGRVLCDVYRRNLLDIAMLDYPISEFIHPVAHTQIGEL